MRGPPVRSEHSVRTLGQRLAGPADTFDALLQMHLAQPNTVTLIRPPVGVGTSQDTRGSLCTQSFTVM